MILIYLDGINGAGSKAEIPRVRERQRVGSHREKREEVEGTERERERESRKGCGWMTGWLASWLDGH